jgi:hypothetical protein
MWHIVVIVNCYIIWICTTYDTTCLLTTSQCRPLHCIISVTPQQWRGRTSPLRNIWKYVYCVIYGTKRSEEVISAFLSFIPIHYIRHVKHAALCKHTCGPHKGYFKGKNCSFYNLNCINVRRTHKKKRHAFLYSKCFYAHCMFLSLSNKNILQ